MAGSGKRIGLERGGVALRVTFSGSVSCLSGVAWITWKGSGDVILEAGQRVRLGRARGVAAQALRGPAVLELEEA